MILKNAPTLKSFLPFKFYSLTLFFVLSFLIMGSCSNKFSKLMIYEESGIQQTSKAEMQQIFNQYSLRGAEFTGASYTLILPMDSSSGIIEKIIEKGEFYVEAFYPTSKSFILEFIYKRFSDRGIIDYIKADDGLVEAEISGIQNEILKGKNKWEKIQFLILSFNQKQLLISVDAHYANGLGSVIPTEGYKDMEAEFHEDISKYTQKIGLQLKFFLLSKYMENYKSTRSAKQNGTNYKPPTTSPANFSK